MPIHYMKSHALKCESIRKNNHVQQRVLCNSVYSVWLYRSAVVFDTSIEIEILFSTPTHACTFFAYELNIHRVYIGPWELTTTDHMHASSRVQNRDLHYGQIWPQNCIDTTTWSGVNIYNYLIYYSNCVVLYKTIRLKQFVNAGDRNPIQPVWRARNVSYA